MDITLTPYEEYKDTELTWMGKVPSHWKILKVKSKFNTVKVPNQEESPTILSLTMNGMKVRDISKNEGQLAQSYIGYNTIEIGDICLNPMDLESGAAAISKFKGVISNAYFTIRPKEPSEINSKFYAEYFNMHYRKRIFYPFGKGVGRPEGSGGRWTLNRDTFFNFPILYLPKPEQDQIVRFLDSKLTKINKFIRDKKKIIELLKEQKQTIINQAVTMGIDPYAKMKPSGIEWIGDIPEGWQVSKLGYTGRFQNGISEAGSFFDFGTSLVSYGDVYNNTQLPFEVEGVANSNIHQQKIYSVKSGDVFFTRTSETIKEIGLSSVCLKTIEGAVFSGFVIRFRPFDNRLYTNFSKYYFRNNKIREYFIREMNIVTRASLSQTLLRNVPVVLPLIDEQKEISNFLDNKTQAIDKAIERINKEIDLIIEYRVSLISSVVTGDVDVRNIEVNDIIEDVETDLDDSEDELIEEEEIGELEED